MADKLDGVAITANSVPSNRIQTGSITSTQLQTSLYNTIVNATHPKIRSLTYPGDDTAANTGGSQTVIINGTGFGTNVAVYINGNSVPSVTVSNANSVSFSTPALSAATYPLYLINTDDGATAILIPGIQYSGTPAWVTTSPLADQTAAAAWSISLSATGDSPIVYSLQAGSTLPAGITLAANGLISGTMTSPPATDTTYNFTVVAIDPQNQDASKAFSVSVTVTVDTQFNYNVLLLHADGTNNGNNHAFLDSSNNNFAITRNGNASQGSFSPFSPSGWSNYLDGSSYVRFAENTAFVFGTGDFTVEAWIYRSSSGVRSEIISHYTNADSGWVLYVNTSDKLGWGEYTGTPVVGTSSIPSNMWVHVAAARSGTTLRLFINGALEASGTVSRDYLTNTNGVSIGTTKPTYTTDPNLVGYISNVRLVKGTALYTAAFTVPTTALTAVSGTSLLTCQSNRFIDNSTNAFAAIIVGTPSVQAFSPFASTTAYSTSSHGGGAYFDGNSDSLTLTSTSSLQLTGVFTIEFWMYLNTIVLDTQHPSVITFPGGWQVYVNSSNLYVALYNGTADVLASASSSITTNQWYHIAISRNASNNLSLYVNGTRVATTTNSGTIGSSSGTLRFMSFDGTGGDANGYISNLRFVNGTAVYDPTLTTLTVPTAPLSAVANTQLLLSCTNGQIFDSTTKAVLECVGNAKVNTSIYKYGTGSMYFPGTTADYIKLNYAGSGNNITTLGTGDFTIETWIYAQNTSPLYQGIFDFRTADPSVTPHITLVSGAPAWWVNGAARITGPVLTTNTWYHLAVSRSASTTKMFLNGMQVGSTFADSNTYISRSVPTIGINFDVLYPFTGYMDDFRITKGLGRYPYNFTPPTKAFADKGGADTSTSDTYFPYTTLLLPGNGTNNANNQAFVDSSTNNFAITRNGNATQGTFSPFSQTGWSGYFDGTANGFITVTDAGSVLDLTGDFTLEFWTYQTALATLNATLNLFLSVDTLDRFQLYQDASNVAFSIGGAVLISSSTRASLNSWNHYAITRSGSTTTLFLNGNSIGSASNNYSMSCASLTIGGQNRSGTANPSSVYHGCNAYISNFRIIKGNALYTSNFTPSSSALTAVSNTSLLTLQSNRFIDTSNNALAITIGSTPSIQAFSPFSPSANNSTSTNGGSGYFDGSGDYLTTTSTQVIPSGSFTVEAWVYPTSSPNLTGVIAQGSTGNAGRFSLCVENSLWFTQIGSTVINTGTPILNAWTHLAVTFNGSTLTFYINGISVGTAATSTNVQNTTLRIGSLGPADWVAYYWPGYISQVRVSNTVRAISVPTAPYSSDGNTTFLMSATNAGITDATGKNVLETVGDAKISTTQSKFGGSSMYFDGTDDRLVTAASPGFAFGTGDFTIEAWIYSADVSNATQRGWIQTSDTAGGLKTTYTTGVLAFFGSPSNGSVGVNIGNTNYTSAAGTISVNTWTHIAFTRYNGTVTVWVNGINVASGTGNTTNLTGQYICVGGYYSTSYLLNGYIDDLRITKGIARYTSNFTPPASALLAK